MVSGVLSVKAWRRKRPVLKWVFSACFAAFTSVGVYGIASCAHGCYLDSLPTVAFQRAFHQEPRGVELLHGHSSHFVDSSGIDLAFHTDRKTFDSLRPATMNRGTIDDYKRLNIYKPKWWRKPVETSDIWISDDESVTTVMTWDSDGLVQFYRTALD